MFFLYGVIILGFVPYLVYTLVSFPDSWDSVIDLGLKTSWCLVDVRIKKDTQKMYILEYYNQSDIVHI